MKVSLIAALALALPIILWQAWAFLAPAVEPHFERVVLVFVVFATALFVAGVAFMYVVVLPRALDFLTSYDSELYDIQIRASYYYTFAAMTLLAGGLAFLMPIFILALVRLRVVTSRQLRRNRKIAFVVLLVFAIMLPTVDPVSLAFEIVPLVLLFEMAIWLSVFMERRWDRGWDEEFAEPELCDGRIGRLGRSRRGAADQRRCGGDRRQDGHDRRGRVRADLGDSVHYEEAVILPGFVNAHTHLEYEVYAGFGDGLRFADWIGLHVQRKQRIALADVEDIARLGAFKCLRSGMTTVGDCSFSGAAATACADRRTARDDLPRGLRRRGRTIRDRFEPMRERIADLPSDRADRDLAACALHVHHRPLPRVRGLGIPIATHLAESDDETEFLRTGGGGWESFADMLVPSARHDRHPCARGGGLLDSNVIAAHCVKADEEEIALLAEHDVAVAHCPRSNGMLGCGVAPLTALREAESACASRPTAQRRRLRSTCSTRCGRRSSAHERGRTDPTR